jgi:hypothetical protein
MTLDLEIVVRDRSTGNETERFVQLSLTPRELGNLHKAIYAIKDGFDIDFVIEED